MFALAGTPEGVPPGFDRDVEGSLKFSQLSLEMLAG